MKIESTTELLYSNNKTVTRNWETLNLSLSRWQEAQLNEIDSDLGIRCLLRMWFTVQSKLVEGTYCNATWDTHYCWPPTAIGTIVRANCSDALRKSHPEYASYLKGSAFRICQKNGNWLKGNWTNFTECADSYDEFVDKAITEAEENELKDNVRYIVFIGSILSLLCLFSAITIFCCFRSIWCDRIILHLHLMAALALRYILLFIITEPFIFNRASNYRDEDWTCKSILILYLYATLSSVNWMFIQGVYINGKLTTNVFDKEPPFKVYYTFGWLVPIPFLGIYAARMEFIHPVKCWKGYSEMIEIWIVLAPILIDLLFNVVFLLNILRILLTAGRSGSSHHSVELLHFRKAAKATIILTPILGLNNLVFTYNPGGVYHKAFVLLNTFFGSTQGVFVACVYCYLSTDVWHAIGRAYHRYHTRRSANRPRISQKINARSGSTTSSVIFDRHVYHYTSETIRTGNEIDQSISTNVQAARTYCGSNTPPCFEEHDHENNILTQNDELSDSFQSFSETSQNMYQVEDRNPFQFLLNCSSSESEYEVATEIMRKYSYDMIPINEFVETLC